MQRLATESRIEHSQETDLPVQEAVFRISTANSQKSRNAIARILLRGHPYV
jgi:hypothetical protein